VSLGVDQTALYYCLLKQAWIWTQVLTSMMSRTPRLVLKPFQVPLCNQNLPPWLTVREATSPRINMVRRHLAGLTLLAGWGPWASNKEVKTLPSKSWMSCQKCCRRTQTETERAPKLLGSKFTREASSCSADSSPEADPREQRGLSLYSI
jgi:hypothetical protein